MTVGAVDGSIMLTLGIVVSSSWGVRVGGTDEKQEEYVARGGGGGSWGEV